MRRNSKTDKEKELIRLSKEYNNLWREKVGYWENLEEPFQNGWYRYYVLREDIKNRTDAQDIRRVLDKINTVVESRREDFTQWDYRKKKYEPIPQKLKTIDEKAYLNLNEKEKSFFVGYWEYPKKNETWKKPTYRYMFRNDYWFVFEKQPRIITRRWVEDGEWASKVAELKNKLNRDNLWPKIYRLQGERVRYYDDYNVRPENEFDMLNEMNELNEK